MPREPAGTGRGRTPCLGKHVALHEVMNKSYAHVETTTSRPVMGGARQGSELCKPCSTLSLCWRVRHQNAHVRAQDASASVRDGSAFPEYAGIHGEMRATTFVLDTPLEVRAGESIDVMFSSLGRLPLGSVDVP